MSDKIPTAEEKLRQFNSHIHESDWRTLHAMREYAKLHVKAALEAAAENATCKDTNEDPYNEIYKVEKYSILSAYPENSIV